MSIECWITTIYSINSIKYNINSLFPYAFLSFCTAVNNFSISTFPLLPTKIFALWEEVQYCRDSNFYWGHWDLFRTIYPFFINSLIFTCNLFLFICHLSLLLFWWASFGNNIRAWVTVSSEFYIAILLGTNSFCDNKLKTLGL